MNQTRLSRFLIALLAFIAVGTFTASAALVPVAQENVPAWNSTDGGGDILTELTDSGDSCALGTTYSSDPTPVPEPSTYLAGSLLALVFGAHALRRRNRKRA